MPARPEGLARSSNMWGHMHAYMAACMRWRRTDFGAPPLRPRLRRRSDASTLEAVMNARSGPLHVASE